MVYFASKQNVGLEGVCVLAKSAHVEILFFKLYIL